MTQKKLKEVKLFDSVEQLSKIAQDLVRRKTELTQRTWVGLTDEEIQECYNEAYKIVQGRRLENAFYKTIEAKLKERNT